MSKETAVLGSGPLGLWALEDRCALRMPLTGRKDLVDLWGRRECQGGCWAEMPPPPGALHHDTFGWRLPDHLVVTFLREFLQQAEAR